MNYLIWRGKDSRDIKGLIICELPPITKPQMRVAETTIDGVDGSVIEELGYSSYDKALSIGITQKADIDEIIAYFTGSGEVVFSNEDDKYYKASIIGQVDYARLVRFKTATVTFRVQPFKYEYEEEQAVLPSGEMAGEVIQLTDKKITELAIEGRSTQNGTPTLDAPIEIQSIGDEGTVEIKQSGKNLFNKETVIVEKAINYNNGTVATSEGITSSNFIKIKPNTQYYCNFVTFSSSTNGMAFYDENKNFISGSKLINSFVSPDNAKYFRFCFRNEEYSSGTSITDINTVQLETGEVATEYEEYKENVIEVPLLEPLRSIPNIAKDVSYIKGNHLYVDRYIGIIVLNGTEGWANSRNDANKKTFLYQTISKSKADNSDINVISSHFIGYTADDLWQKDIVGISLNANGYIQVGCNFATTTELKNWLSNNNVIVLYKLQQPYMEEARELPYLELVNGENDLSNSENANMIVSYVDNKMLVDNVGNYKAKPIIEIKGTGEIRLAVNGDTLFRYTFPDGEDTVIIDSQKQDAYLGAVLKNRNMSGEFPIFEIGKNTITWEGNISSIKISSKSRWL